MSRSRSREDSPMARAIWSGTISFGLVTIPVKLYHAVSHKSVSFNQLNRETGNRIRYRKVDAVTGDEVADEQIVKGYELRKGEYVVVDPDELEELLPTAHRAIELEEFIEQAEIDPVYYDSPYYLAPDRSAKPYTLLLRAMADAGRIGIGRFVMRNKEYVAAIRAQDGHLVLSTLVHADEVVDPATIVELHDLDDVTISDRELAMAVQLVESLVAPFEPERYPDTHRERLLELIERKAAGEVLAVPEAPAAAPQVVDLMAALEASVEAAKAARARHPTARPASADEETPKVVEVPAKSSRRRKSA